VSNDDLIQKQFLFVGHSVCLFILGLYNRDIDIESSFFEINSISVETMLSYREGKSEACSP